MQKKVLIINASSIYQNNATGITLRSIFENIDTSSLMEVYWDGQVIDIDNRKINSYKLNYKNYHLINILKNFRRSKINGSIKKNNNSALESKMSSKKKFLTFSRQYMALLPDRAKLDINNNFYNMIESFKPEVIYTLGASVNALKLSYHLSLKYNIPIIIHHMDNWLHAIQWENNPLLSSYKKELRKYCKLCYSRSSNCIAISEKMANDFSKETGIKHDVIMNSIDEPQSDFKIKRYNNVFNLVYAGGLHLDRYKSLLDIGNVIEKLELPIKFHIYTNQANIDNFDHLFSKLTKTIFHQSVSHEEINSIYSKADALTHVETESLVNNDFFKYSISTKIPEYLSTGKQVFLYCPSNIYLFQFLSSNNLAETVSNYSEIENALRKLVSKSEEELKQIYSHNKNYAKEYFSKKKAINTFESVVNNSIIK